VDGIVRWALPEVNSVMIELLFEEAFT